MQKSLRRALTLVELAGVVGLLAILAGILVSRVGNTRAAAVATRLHLDEKAFSMAVEALVAAGIDPKPTLLSDRTTYTYVGEIASDPVFMGLKTRTYRLSSPSQLNASAVNTLYDRLNTLLQAHDPGFSGLQGTLTDQQLRNYNADLVEAVLGSVYLKIHPVP